MSGSRGRHDLRDIHVCPSVWYLGHPDTPVRTRDRTPPPVRRRPQGGRDTIPPKIFLSSEFKPLSLFPHLSSSFVHPAPHRLVQVLHLGLDHGPCSRWLGGVSEAVESESLTSPIPESLRESVPGPGFDHLSGDPGLRDVSPKRTTTRSSPCRGKVAGRPSLPPSVPEGPDLCRRDLLPYLRFGDGEG